MPPALVATPNCGFFFPVSRLRKKAQLIAGGVSVVVLLLLLLGPSQPLKKIKIFALPNRCGPTQCQCSPAFGGGCADIENGWGEGNNCLGVFQT